MAVKKDATVIGHLPRKISRICYREARRKCSVHGHDGKSAMAIKVPYTVWSIHLIDSSSYHHSMALGNVCWVNLI